MDARGSLSPRILGLGTGFGQRRTPGSADNAGRLVTFGADDGARPSGGYTDKAGRIHERLVKPNSPDVGEAIQGSRLVHHKRTWCAFH